MSGATGLADLPRVARILPGQGSGFTLELEDGQTVAILQGHHASLAPITSEGLAGLVHWPDGYDPEAGVYAVPAALYLKLLAYFPEGGPTETDALPTLIGAERLADTLTLYAQGYQPLTLPRKGSWVQPAGFDPGASRPAILALHVYPPGVRDKCHSFRVDTSTLEGAAALTALGLSYLALGRVAQKEV